MEQDNCRLIGRGLVELKCLWWNTYQVYKARNSRVEWLQEWNGLNQSKVRVRVFLCIACIVCIFFRQDTQRAPHLLVVLLLAIITLINRQTEISRSNAVIPTNGYDNNKKQDTHATIESKLLHVCSESNVTVQDIAPLLQQDPDAIMTKTQKEMRPLHIACWKGASVDVVEYLIQAWPDSVMARTTRQWIPLHVACAASNADAQVQLNVIKCLVQHSPESTKAKDNKERIPLHVACFSKAPLEVVQYLVQEWPDSVMAMNNYESLPLHLACGTCADLSVIQFLVKCKPESLDAVDSEGRTAYDMAKHPLQSDEPDEETVAWLHNVLHSRSKQEKKKQGHFEKERGKLKQVITGEKEKPVAVSSDYVEAIMQGELGKGYFGVVFMGNDTVLKQQFAIKKINRKILVGGNKDDLECVKKEFKREQKVRRVCLV